MTDNLPPLPPYLYGEECSTNERVWTERDMLAYAAAAVSAERERCAAICDALAKVGASRDAAACSAAIRGHAGPLIAPK